MNLWTDTETYSECDLKAHGMYRYAEHPTTEVMMVQFAAGDGPVNIVDFTDPAFDFNLWYRFLDLLENDDTTMVAHNATFDLLMLKILGITVPEDRVIDSAAQCRAVGLPGGLDAACKAIGLPQEQRKISGGRFIQLFSKPQPANRKLRRCTRYTHAEEWDLFLDYGARDVSAMRELCRRLPNHGDI